MRYLAYIIIGYLLLLLLMRVALWHVTKVAAPRADTPEGQRRLREVYHAQRDKAESERLSNDH